MKTAHIEKLLTEATAAAISDDLTAGEYKDLINRLVNVTTIVQAQNTQLREQARTAHNDLVAIAAELNWATDGSLRTAVAHVRELDRVRRDTIGQLRTSVNA